MSTEKKYNTFFISTGEGGGDIGVTIHTHPMFDIKEQDVYINKDGLALAVYISMRGTKEFSQFFCNDLNQIKIEKITE